MALLIFAGSFCLLAYIYAGYPAVMCLLSRAVGRPVRNNEAVPAVTIIIAAFNEERDIASKLENTLALDYPPDKIEIMVASDCSTDATNAIVKRYACRGVRLIAQPRRLGKTAAQNRAAALSKGEVLVFSDATTHYKPDAIRKIVRSFADPEVGCISGRVAYIDSQSTAVGRGICSYWSYESFLKTREALCGGLIGVCGCLYAVRRRNYRPLANDMCSDFVIASEMQLQGLRAVYEPEAIAAELTNERGRDEFRMRVRIAEQTISSLYRYHRIFNPWRHGVFAFQMLCHKVLRYTVPVLLVLLYSSNWFLINSNPVFRSAVGVQSIFYLAAVGGWILERLGVRQGLFGLPYYLVLANAAIVAGFIKFATGQSYVVWQPIRGEALTAEAGNSGRGS